MTRHYLGFGALLLAILPARADDPQPVWKIDTIKDLSTAREVPSVVFSPNGKVLLAQVVSVVRTGLALKAEELVAWDSKSRKELFRRKIGGVSPPFKGNGIAASNSTALVANGRAMEIRLSDGEVSFLQVSKHGDVSSVWLDSGTRNAAWLIGHSGEDVKLPRSLAIGKVPPFEGGPKIAERKVKWSNAILNTARESWGMRAVAVNPDLTRVAVGVRGDEHTLSVYAIEAAENLKLKEMYTVPSVHRGPISVILYSPDGKILATASDDSSIFLWDLSKAGKDWKPYATIPAGRFTVSCLAFSPDGRTLAAGTFDQKGSPNLFLVDVHGGKLLSSHHLREAMTSLTYSPDGQTLITGHDHGRIYAWSAAAIRRD